MIQFDESLVPLFKELEKIALIVLVRTLSLKQGLIFLRRHFSKLLSFKNHQGHFFRVRVLLEHEGYFLSQGELFMPSVQRSQKLFYPFTTYVDFSRSEFKRPSYLSSLFLFFYSLVKKIDSSLFSSFVKSERNSRVRTKTPLVQRIIGIFAGLS